VFDLLPTQIGFFEYDAANGHGIGQLVDTPPTSADATAQLTSTNSGNAMTLADGSGRKPRIRAGSCSPALGPLGHGRRRHASRRDA